MKNLDIKWVHKLIDLHYEPQCLVNTASQEYSLQPEMPCTLSCWAPQIFMTTKSLNQPVHIGTY